MALESAIASLRRSLDRLHQVLAQEARVIVLEDRPRANAEPIDRLCDAFVDVIGWLEGAKESADAAARAAAYPADLYRARRTLADGHDRFRRCANAFAYELASYERLSTVKEYCSEHGSEWRAWWKEAVASIDRCREPIGAVERALLACWQELTDRLGAGGTSIHAQLGHTVTVHEMSQEKSDEQT